MNSPIQQNPDLTGMNTSNPVRDDWLIPSHGGSLTAVSQVTGYPAEHFVDFSVSLNPLGPPDCAQDICSHSLSFLNDYPEPQYRKFKQALSLSLGVTEENFVLGNGSTELIYLLPRLLQREKRVLIVSPCFSEYERAFQQNGNPVRHFLLNPANGFSPIIQPLLKQIRQSPDLGGIVIGHPNNPTGTLWDDECFLALQSFCRPRGIFLFVDETFIDFAGPENSFLKYLDSSPQLVLIRSMTKFYSLPGLRLGYGIMNSGKAAILQMHQPPWSVNALAEAMGPPLIRDQNFPEASKQFIRREKDFVLQHLSGLKAIEIFPSHANFFLFRLRGASERLAMIFYETLLHRGLVLRNCQNFNGLDASYFRMAIRGRNENRRLISSIAGYFKTDGM